MLRLLLVLVLNCACCVIAAAQPTLIHFGWDNPSIEELPDVLPKLEASVFDGLSISAPAYNHVFKANDVTAAEFEKQAAILKSLKPGALANSYLVMLAAADDTFDWRNDEEWRARLSNVEAMARLARVGGMKGVVFDMEPYGKSPWHYETQIGKDQLSFEAYRSLVQKRGREMMMALQGEFPGLDVWNLFGLSAHNYMLGDPLAASEPNRLLIEDGYGLWSAFFGGMVQAAAPTTRVIDGNEPSYYFTRNGDFILGRQVIMGDLQNFLPDDAKADYAKNIKVGNAVYLDGVMNLHASPRFIGYYFKSDEDRLELLSRNTANALSTSDSLVWVYAEKAKWWQGNAPAKIESALKAAKLNVAETAALPASTALIEAEKALAARVTISGTVKDKDGRGLKVESYGSILNDAACSAWGDLGQYSCVFPKGSNVELRPRVEGRALEPAVQRFGKLTEPQNGINWLVR